MEFCRWTGDGMSPVNQMVKNKQNQLTVKLYQFQGKLVIFSSSCRRHTKVGGWVHIHTEKKQYRRQKCYACAFWDNCMLVVQHQKQQLSTQTPATVLSRKPYNDTHLRKNIIIISGMEIEWWRHIRFSLSLMMPRWAASSP